MIAQMAIQVNRSLHTIIASINEESFLDQLTPTAPKFAN